MYRFVAVISVVVVHAFFVAMTTNAHISSNQYMPIADGCSLASGLFAIYISRPGARWAALDLMVITFVDLGSLVLWLALMIQEWNDYEAHFLSDDAHVVQNYMTCVLTALLFYSCITICAWEKWGRPRTPGGVQ